MPISNPGADGLHPVAPTSVDQCDSFYQCAAGHRWEKKCPANLAFNPAVSVCDYMENVCAQSDIPAAFQTMCCKNH